jgi:cell division initiation protein
MKITPLDIQQKQFRVKFRGFDILEVDTFLEQLAVSFRFLLQENAGFHEEIKKLKIETQRSKEREKAFERAMSNSQKALEQMRENAKKSADLVVAGAEVVAEKMLTRAHNRLAQLHEDIAELKRQRMQIEVQIRSIIETHTKLLEMGKEDMKAMDEEDSKLKLLKKSETTSL